MARTFRRRSRSFRTSSPRRKRAWARSINSQVIDPAVDLGLVGFDLLENWEHQTGANLPGLTVARMLGDLVIQPVMAGDNVEVVVGVGVFSNEVLEQAMAVIDPQQSAGRTEDWMYWKRFILPQAADPQTGRVAVDIKSMRKIERSNQTLVLAVNGSGNQLQFDATFSTLVLMP